LIKILDMGLVRPQAGGLNAAAAGHLTEKGILMGTPDYISPEQALNAQTVDIRADLYSLGATFYFLVTGRVPFPGGTAMDKIIRQRMDEPPPIARLRPEATPEVISIIRKLMAKPAELRIQTPAELVKILATYLAQADKSAKPRRK
jgi:serine/threonine-protein kinase